MIIDKFCIFKRLEFKLRYKKFVKFWNNKIDKRNLYQKNF